MTGPVAAAPGENTEGGTEIKRGGRITHNDTPRVSHPCDFGNALNCKKRTNWASVLDRAHQIIAASVYVLTLRGLHYQLVVNAADLGYVNTSTAYKTLSSRTAEARRAGMFPALAEDARSFDGWRGDTSPSDAVDQLARYYRRDRTEGQACSLVLAIEKRTLVPVLAQAFGQTGIPIVALGGFSSQTLADKVADSVERTERPGVLLIASDHDPSGEEIVRDFTDRTAQAWEHVERVALTAEQAEGLPTAPGKRTDSRAVAFVARHGELVQVELEAMTPADLVAAYRDALAPFWDVSAFDDVIAREAAERQQLQEWAVTS